MSSFEAPRRPAGHLSAVSACSTLSRYAATAESAAAASSAADVDGGARGVAESSQVRPNASGDPPVVMYVVDDEDDDDVVDHEDRDADDGDREHSDGLAVPPGTSQKCPMSTDRGERLSSCSRAAHFFFRVSGKCS